jgi:hypothetical protein
MSRIRRDEIPLHDTVPMRYPVHRRSKDAVLGEEAWSRRATDRLLLVLSALATGRARIARRADPFVRGGSDGP